MGRIRGLLRLLDVNSSFVFGSQSMSSYMFVKIRLTHKKNTSHTQEEYVSHTMETGLYLIPKFLQNG